MWMLGLLQQSQNKISVHPEPVEGRTLRTLRQAQGERCNAMPLAKKAPQTHQ